MSIDWNALTPASALVGGAIIGAAAALLAVLNGRIAGISGILGGLFRPEETSRKTARLARSRGSLEDRARLSCVPLEDEEVLVGQERVFLDGRVTGPG
jgi:hypothetical protein